MKVSVIMPSLNVAPYIEKCIKSVINQSLQDIEIICVDAGSTDGTLEILENYSNKDKRIKLVHSPVKSYGYQVNLGICMARGDYIGIVETDDFVDSNMYEVLYGLAIEHQLDYAKGMFDMFVSIDSNNEVRWRHQSFGNHTELINRIVGPSDIAYIYANDTSVWSGIYRKSFLEENSISFNESAGAAYQDIGFMQQVVGCAKKACYTSQSLYRYRVDREEASTLSPKVLMYAKAEFERLLQQKELYNKIKNKAGFFSRMLGCFLGELKKVLPAVKYDINSEYVKEAYDWFKKQLKDHYTLSIDERNKEEYKHFLEDETKYIYEERRKFEAKEKKRNEICDAIGTRSVVIFGAGLLGKYALKFLLARNFRIVAFCDNCTEKQTDITEKLPVLDLSKCKKMYKQAVYVVANKNNSREIYLQLINDGIDDSHIVIYPCD